MKKMILLGLVLSSCGCAARLGRWDSKTTNARLEVEHRRLAREKDPVERTRTYIKMAQVLMEAIRSAAHRSDLDEMGTLLSNYAKVVESAEDTMVNSGRDPDEDAEGFTDLEVILREHTRYLQDIRRSLSVSERPPVDSAVAIATSLREELLSVLFSEVKR